MNGIWNWSTYWEACQGFIWLCGQVRLLMEETSMEVKASSPNNPNGSEVCDKALGLDYLTRDKRMAGDSAQEQRQNPIPKEQWGCGIHLHKGTQSWLRAGRGPGIHLTSCRRQNAEATSISGFHASPIRRLWCHPLWVQRGALQNTHWVWTCVLHEGFNVLFSPPVYCTLFPWLKLEKQKDCLLIGESKVYCHSN